MPLSAGQTFAGYTIIRLVGSGGMGEVYLAQHPRLPRQDAIKVLRPDVSADEDYRQRFIREADLAATLWHPNIVAVHDRGDEDGQLWISMDYVDGIDLARLLADRYPAGMPVEDVSRIVTAVASALDHAHAQGLLHRDIKPANVMMTNLDGDGEQRILLMDFGIARNVDDISGLTVTNMTVGTMAYCAPEQLIGDDVDGRADQYSLAATAYHLLTGSQLFPNSNPAVVISRHLNMPPPTLAAARPELAALDSVLAVALAKAPSDRFPRCTDFAAAFTEATQSGGAATSWAATMQAPAATKPPQGTPPTGAGTPTGKPRRPRRRMVLAGTAATVVALTAAGIIGYQHIHKPKPPVAVLDGTYRLVLDNSKMTLNGAPNPDSPAEVTAWWAFRSSCYSATTCVATGTKLDDTNHQVTHASAGTAISRFTDGHWQRDPVRVQEDLSHCLGGDQKAVVGGQDTALVTWSLEPQLDGTLRGTATSTVVSNQCGRAGIVDQLPTVATRTGDAPSGVTVANPANVPVAPVPRVPAAGGPVLTGSYRLDFDEADQTANGHPARGGPNSETDWWAFRSWCSTPTRCVATAATLSDDNHQQPSGKEVRVMDFADGHWQNTPHLMGTKCSAGNGADSGVDVWSLEPQADGTLRGTATKTSLTDECGRQGLVFRTPVVLTRIGDVPPAVILADPTLF